ncbi:MAG TPA: CoA transferase [Gammaproteobacteria bacterium]|mgnify:CR=1 FL=1|nr:CoA transferase [Gammaproteobacteria bacterium]
MNVEQCSPGPLTGLRILDLSRVLAGPVCTQLLGDLGAEVIKVEQPGKGDDTRCWGPPFVVDAQGRNTTESAYYLAANRNKRSLTIDLSVSDGQSLLRQLALRSDVVIENFKVGTMAKFNLDYNRLQDNHKELVYCSISGFGQDGPYAQRPGYDFLVQAMGGLMSLGGPVDAAPSKTGVAIADIMCGMYATVAIQAAIRHCDITGQGQYIDVALLDTQLAWLANVGSSYLLSGQKPERFGNGHPSIVPYDIFPVADGHMALAVGNDRQFSRLCQFIGAERLAQDTRFISNMLRVKHRQQLHPLLCERLIVKPSEYWIQGLNRLEVPCGPVNTVDQAFADPQVQHRKMVISIPYSDAAGGEIKMVANPLKFSATPVRYSLSPPKLGQDSDVVLQSVLGLDTEAIAKLREQGVI